MTKNITVSDPLDRAILDLIESVPNIWKDFDYDSLSSTQQEALKLLTGAGIIEQRNKMRLRMIGDPIILFITFRCTGEYGLVEVVEKIAAAVLHWKNDDGKLKNQLLSERDNQFQMRLTDQGELAKKDINDGRQSCTIEFIRKSGFFKNRPVVKGFGIVESLDIKNSSETHNSKNVAFASAQASINIQNNINLDSLASAMENMVEKLFSSKQKPEKQQAVPEPIHKRRGPERISLQEAKKRIAILQKWADRQEKNKNPDYSPSTLQQFARSMNINLNEIKAYQAWYRKYSTKGQLPYDPRTINPRELIQLFA